MCFDFRRYLEFKLGASVSQQTTTETSRRSEYVTVSAVVNFFENKCKLK